MSGSYLEPIELSEERACNPRTVGPTPEERASVGASVSHRLGMCGWKNQTRQSPTSRVSGEGRLASGRQDSSIERLDGLHDEPRPGAPRTIGDDAVEAVVVKTLEETPLDATHWSTRSMAKATGMSQSAVSRIWRAFGLKPHLVETFKLSPDPLFVEKVRDIVGLYVNPPDGRSGALCRREDPDPSARSHLAGASAAPGAPRAAHPRLRAWRHDQPLRRPRRRLGSGHRRHDRAASCRRVPEVLEPDQPQRARGPRRPPRRRQRLDPQDPRDPAVAAAPPAIPPPLHAHLQLVDQPRRALVRRAHQQVAPPRHPPIDQRTRSGHHHWIDSGTKNPSPSSGTRAPTRSSTRWLPTARGSLTQVTRRQRVGASAVCLSLPRGEGCG